MRKRAPIFILIAFMITLVAPIYYPVITEADSSGDLKINNQSIYQKGENSNSEGTTTFTINDLFLTEKSEMDKKIQQTPTQTVKKAQNQLFVQSLPATKESLTNKVTNVLFQNSDTGSDNELQKNKSVSNHNNQKIIVFILVVFGGTIFVILGVVLGNRFSHYKNRRGAS